MERKMNIIMRTDSYKFSQYRQYPKGTTHVFSYIESRGGKYDQTVMVGLQYYLKKYLDVTVTHEMVDYAASRVRKHMMPGKVNGPSFNEEGWRYIVDKCGGKLPLIIRAVPEGTVVKTKNVLVTVENTDPKCFWLTSYLETLLMKIWYPITVATTSYEIKKILVAQMKETCDDLSGLPFKLHDFGYRGVSSEESAEIGGLAHVCNFMGSDTPPAFECAQDFYSSDMAAFSIDATEHSTVTSWGRENERQAYEHMAEIYKDKPIFACVSDSYDITKACGMWNDMAPVIKANGQIVVVRPDSGDPVMMATHCVMELEKGFGCTVNQKGYKILNSARVIYGDGISSPKVVEEILNYAKRAGYSAENFAFGMGGGLLQKCDRDTQKFAMKCSHITLEDGSEIDVYKDPVTDPGKKSKTGKLDLVRNEQGELVTVKLSKTWNDYALTNIYQPHHNSVMQTVYENGKILVDVTLDEIRKRIDENL